MKLAIGSVVAAFALVLAGCAGQVDDDDATDLEISDTTSTSAALASPDLDDEDGDTTGYEGDGERGEVGDKDCNDRDHAGHKRHHRHKFKMLDRIDGNKDGNITLAALPAGLPERLLAKLARLDADHDGIVTKAEVKTFRKHRKHRGEGHRKGERAPGGG